MRLACSAYWLSLVQRLLLHVLLQMSSSLVLTPILPRKPPDENHHHEDAEPQDRQKLHHRILPIRPPKHREGETSPPHPPSSAPRTPPPPVCTYRFHLHRHVRCVWLRDTEVLHTEQLSWVCPDPLDGKARACCQLCKLLERIFVRTLRPDALAQFEGNLTLPNANRLVFQTDQMHLDATLTRIIEGIVPKLAQLEVGVQFLVHAHQQLLIELCCHPLGIIIGTMQDVEVLLQIHSDEQTTTLTGPGNLVQKVFGRLTVEVADGRSRKVGDPPQDGFAWQGQLEVARVVGTDRQHFQLGIRQGQ